MARSALFGMGFDRCFGAVSFGLRVVTKERLSGNTACRYARRCHCGSQYRNRERAGGIFVFSDPSSICSWRRVAVVCNGAVRALLNAGHDLNRLLDESGERASVAPLANISPKKPTRMGRVELPFNTPRWRLTIAFFVATLIR